MVLGEYRRLWHSEICQVLAKNVGLGVLAKLTPTLCFDIFLPMGGRKEFLRCSFVTGQFVSLSLRKARANSEAGQSVLFSVKMAIERPLPGVDLRQVPLYRDFGGLHGQKESPRIGTGARPENIMKVKGIGQNLHVSRPEYL
jgi:hypothetical protein